MRRLAIPRSLQNRLLLTFLAVNFLSAGIFIAWADQRFQADTVAQAESELDSQVHIIGDALRDPLEHTQGLQNPGTPSPENQGQSYEGRSLADLVQSFAQNTGTRVTVLDQNLSVISSSDPQVKVGASYTSEPEFASIQPGRNLHDIREDPASGEQRLYVAAPIVGRGGPRPAGYVQISVPMAPIYDSLRQTRLTLIGLAALVLTITALASLLIARQTAQPVQQLTRTSEALARGQLAERVTPAGPDEIQRLGRAFNQMADRLQAMLVRQREFVADAAHELRSPLTSLRLRLEILEGQAGQAPELTRRYLKQMDRELAYLQTLVEQLLTLSALDEGERAPRAPLDLAPTLYELADDMAPLVQQAQLHLALSLPDHLPAANVNPQQIRIVVRNLLDNAIKYTPAGGNITLRAESMDGRLDISVADTGVGIPADEQAQIFERFYRVDKSRAGKQRGSGLGLALARALVDANDGTLRVQSEPGAGSIFTVSLPITSMTAITG